MLHSHYCNSYSDGFWYLSNYFVFRLVIDMCLPRIVDLYLTLPILSMDNLQTVSIKINVILGRISVLVHNMAEEDIVCEKV